MCSDGYYLTRSEWSAQTWDANSLSRSNSKLRIISSKVVPVGFPELLNRQPHAEQPKPRKRSCSIHTSLRLMTASVAAPQRAVPQRADGCAPGTKRSGSPLTAPFAAARCLIAAENPYPLWAWRNIRKRRGSLQAPIWMVCRASYIQWKGLIRARAQFRGPRLKCANRLRVGHVLCVAMLARSSGKTNVGCPTEPLRLGMYNFAE